MCSIRPRPNLEDRVASSRRTTVGFLEVDDFRESYRMTEKPQQERGVGRGFSWDVESSEIDDAAAAGVG